MYKFVINPRDYFQVLGHLLLVDWNLSRAYLSRMIKIIIYVDIAFFYSRVGWWAGSGG